MYGCTRVATLASKLEGTLIAFVACRFIITVSPSLSSLSTWITLVELENVAPLTSTLVNPSELFNFKSPPKRAVLVNEVNAELVRSTSPLKMVSLVVVNVANDVAPPKSVVVVTAALEKSTELKAVHVYVVSSTTVLFETLFNVDLLKSRVVKALH